MNERRVISENTFGKRLCALRKQKKLTQMALSMKINISQATISAYETGRFQPDIQAIILIAKFFDVSIDFLLGQDDIQRKYCEQYLSQFEANIVNNFRKLDVRGQEELSSISDTILEMYLKNNGKPRQEQV